MLSKYRFGVVLAILAVLSACQVALFITVS
jgi:hypothetical protein